MKLTPENLEVVRTKPQYTRLNLFIYEPQEVLRGQISNPTSAKNDVAIYVDGVTTGTYYDIYNGMTMKVGSTEGDDDLGRIRVRSSNIDGSSPSGSIIVSENSNINWKDGQYISVLDYSDVLPVFPRIIQNPSNATDVIFYKDYDVSYSGQNRYMGSVLNMGSHRARTIGDAGYAQISWSASGTWNVDNEEITSYQWKFGGGTPTGSLSVIPGLVTYNTPGNYVTELTTTSASGTIDTSYRYVAIRDEIGKGDYTPVVRWEMSNLSGSRGEGGYSADFTVYDKLDIQGNALVMLTADDWYGSNHVSLGGNRPEEPYMFFVGYIDKDSIKYDYRQSKVEFSAMSITELMKQSVGFSVSVESKNVPSTWYELYNMDCRRAIHHYLKWHSTILQTTDFEFRGQDYYIQFFDADRASMFDAVDNLMRSALVGNICADRTGRLYAEVEPRAYPYPTGTFDPVMDITRRDWIDEPDVEERISDSISYIEMGGIQYLGSALNTFTPLLACAPGKTPSFRGSIRKEQGLALGGQSHLNTLVGNIFADENSKFPNISMDMSEGLRNLDIAPYEVVNMDIRKSDTVRNEDITGLYTPDRMSWKYNHKDGLLLPSIDFRQVVNGFDGDTIKIVIPSDGSTTPSFDPIDFTPVIIPPIATGTVTSDPESVICASTNFGIIYCTNFNDIAPVWKTMNEGLTPTQYNDVDAIEVTPIKSIFILVNSGVNGKVYFAENLGDTWTLVAESSTWDYIRGMAVSTSLSEKVALLRGGFRATPFEVTPVAQFAIGDRNGFANISTFTTINRAEYSQITWHQGGWYVVTTAHGSGLAGAITFGVVFRMTPSGGRADYGYITAWSDNIPSAQYATGFGEFSKAIVWRNPASVINDGYKLFNGAELGIRKFDILPAQAQSISGGTDGLRVMGGFDGVFTPYRSFDAGETWESLALTIPVGMSVWDNCGDDTRWVFGGGTNIKYTKSFGDDYIPGDPNYNKEGNLSPDFPLINIIRMRYVG